MISRNKKRREKGQAMVEFAFVLPLFLLLVMGIIDFGWLFYNYISVENSARNAARIACVEYMDCTVVNSNGKKLPYYYVNDGNNKNFDFGIMKNHIAEGDSEDYYTEQEINIYNAANASLPKTVTSPKMTINYSYDKDMEGDSINYLVNDRSKGTVTVTVEAKMHVLTPVLGAFSDDMQRTLISQATYKVEVRPEEDD